MSTSVVPHLATALQGPLEALETQLLDQATVIERWFRQQWLHTPAPFYASVDLRNAGYKLAPVDTNLFPAGFNNLSEQFRPLCIQAVQSAVERVCPTAGRILILPENHSRNQFYFQNLAALYEIIEQAGFEVRIGSLLPEGEDERSVTLANGTEIPIEQVQRDGDTLRIGDFVPCSILLNNDLSAGRPELLEGLRQKVMPPLELGWSNRLKSQHFAEYRKVVDEFSAEVGMDSWLLAPLFRNCGNVDFRNREGMECLNRNVEVLLQEIAAKYKEHGIEQEPFVVVKADSGTYGMGIMSVRSTEELANLNRKQRNKMATRKEGAEASTVIIQEGVYTSERVDDATAEPVVYMIDHFVVGGFYRLHSGKSHSDNLNSPGMSFKPLAFAACGNNPDLHGAPDDDPNRFYAYGVIARLALLAAAREIDTEQKRADS